MQLSAFPFSTILFDLDGTLVDSAPDVLEAIAAVLRDAGDPVPRMELSIIGPPLEGIFREEPRHGGLRCEYRRARILGS